MVALDPPNSFIWLHSIEVQENGKLILVSGGCGFIGSHVVRGLTEEGLDAIAFDVVRPSPLPQPLREVVDNVELVTGDVTNLGDLEQVFSEYQVEQVVHLAWQVWRNVGPLHAIKNNFGGTANMLEMARRQKVQRVVFSSTENAYGPADHQREPVTEESPLWPSARKDSIIYNSLKAMCEYLGDHYSITYGLEFIALRFATVYGLGLTSDAWYAQIVEKPVLGVPCQLSKKRGNTYNFLYVKDCVKAVQLALQAPAPKYRIFNISGGGYSIQDIADLVKKFIPDADIRLEEGKDPALTPPIMDITRARDVLGFTPTYTLEQGIKAYIETLTQHHKTN